MCRTEYPYFKLLESKRDSTRDPDEKGDHAGGVKGEEKKYPKFWRVCVPCEVKEREKEWNEKMSEEEKKKYPDYCEEWRVHKDLKSANEGKVE